MRKRAVQVLLFCLAFWLFAGASLAASAPVIDGDTRGNEWHEAEGHSLFSSAKESNNGVQFAYMKVLFRPKENAVYLMFQVLAADLHAETLQTGVQLRINGGALLCARADGTCTYDAAAIGVTAAFQLDTNSGVTGELRIGFKQPMPDILHLELQILDAAGEPSLVKPVTLSNPQAVSEDTTQAAAKPTAATKDTKTTTQKATTTKKSKANGSVSPRQNSGGGGFTPGDNEAYLQEEGTALPNDAPQAGGDVDTNTAAPVMQVPSPQTASRLKRYGLLSVAVLLLAAAVVAGLRAGKKESSSANTTDNLDDPHDTFPDS